MTDAPPSPLIPFGWTARVERLAAPLRGPGRSVGRVIRVARGFDTVRLDDGEVLCPRAHPTHRAAELPGPPVVGDWALVLHDRPSRLAGAGSDSADRPDSDDRPDSRRDDRADDRIEREPAIVGLLPRWGTLSRRDPANRDREQVVAADVDLIVLAFGLDRPFRPGRLERSLILAHAGGAEPVIALTKTDVAKYEAQADVALTALAPDVPCVRTSTATGAGVAELAVLIAHGGTAVILGESGAGKSSLVNALLGRPAQQVADVRSGDRRGRHTTTTRELFPLPGGGAVIDTPGVRALGLWTELDDELPGVEEAFPEITAMAGDCRFRDCGHRGEPGCAVAAAVVEGRLAAARLDRFRALNVEIDALEQRRRAWSYRQADGPAAETSRQPRGGTGSRPGRRRR